MPNASSKIDPIREEYFGPLETADKWAEFLFYLSAALSLVVPLVEKSSHPTAYNVFQALFVLAVAGVCVSGIATRLYFAPRAQVRRYQDFLSHAYGVALTHDQSIGYYNNDSEVGDSSRRIAAQTLENSFYSKDTSLRMARVERLKLLVYTILFTIVILNRNTDMGIIAIATQIVFSEQLLSYWFRMEWFRRAQGVREDV